MPAADLANLNPIVGADYPRVRSRCQQQCATGEKISARQGIHGKAPCVIGLCSMTGTNDAPPAGPMIRQQCVRSYFCSRARDSTGIMPIPMPARASVPARMVIVLLACAVSVLAQEPVLLDGKPVFMIANDKVTLAVRSEGGAMVRLVLKDDPAAVNPLHAELGHFVCVDGFGPVSPEERSAGLPGHGEAHRVPWDLVASGRTNAAGGAGTTTLSFF